MYNEIVLDHFQNPRNLKELPKPDAYGVGANPTCGDVLKLYLKVKNGKIEDASFKTMGCGAAIASGSILTEYLKGKTLDQAKKLKPKQLISLLGGLPAIKLHCPELAIEALTHALKSKKPKAASSAK